MASHFWTKRLKSQRGLPSAVPATLSANRREFLALASIFGASAASAYAMAGLAYPAFAQATDPQPGGILRVAMGVRPLKDPRTYDWPEMGNIGRQFMETLIRYDHDFTFKGLLLERWEISEDAKTYTFHCRRNASWNNGDPFTVDDVIFNLSRWADRTVPGNSMASRLDTLIDPISGKLDMARVKRLDDYTLQLELSRPDITLIPSLSDYPALLVHRLFDTQHAQDHINFPVGTGPFELVSHEAGIGARFKRRESGWWGGVVPLEGLFFTDASTSSFQNVELFANGDIDLNYQTTGDLVAVLDGLGLQKSEIDTAATLVCRMNVNHPPYDDRRVRRALQLAVDNNVLLQLGIAGLGKEAENHHVCPIHPEYAELPPEERDWSESRRLLEEADQLEFEHELISFDQGWQKNTADVLAGKLRESGISVKRTLKPGSEFWENWANFPFSATEWNMRPLGVQVLALAYRTGEAWNESGFSSAEFDEKLNQALGRVDPDERRILMADLQKILQSSGVIIQPFWRSLFCHFRDEVQGYAMHPSFEMHFEKTWIQQA